MKSLLKTLTETQAKYGRLPYVGAKYKQLF